MNKLNSVWFTSPKPDLSFWIKEVSEDKVQLRRLAERYMILHISYRNRKLGRGSVAVTNRNVVTSKWQSKNGGS